MKTNTIHPYSNKKVLWIGLLTLLSIIVHGYLAMQHYFLKLGLSDSQSLCNVNDRFNCDAVAISNYSTLFGIPIAILGFFTHLTVLVVLAGLLLRSIDDRPRFFRFIHTFALFIASVSVVMALIAWLKLGTFCLFCILAYILSFLMLIFTTPLASHWQSSFSSDMKSLLKTHRWVLGLCVSVPVLSFVSHLLIMDSLGFGKLNLFVQESLLQWKSASIYTFSTDPSQGLQLMSKGSVTSTNKNNKNIHNDVSTISTAATPPPNGDEPLMRIVEFADYLCPHCKTAGPTLQAFTLSHPQVQLIFKFFPLDGTCNPAITQKGDGLRCQLAQSVHCAEKIFKKGWLVHEWIFSRQEKLHSSIGKTKDIFDELEMDLFAKIKPDESKMQGEEALKTEFRNCLQSEEALQSVRAQAEEGMRAQIEGTPAIFVNGRRLERGQFAPFLQAVYETVLGE